MARGDRVCIICGKKYHYCGSNCQEPNAKETWRALYCDVLNGAEPRAWKISKINRINSNGVILATLAQDLFDQHKDYIEYEDENDPSSIQGMYADYYADGLIPSDYQEKTPKFRLEITYPGKPEIKIGGNYKNEC